MPVPQGKRTKHPRTCKGCGKTVRPFMLEIVPMKEIVGGPTIPARKVLECPEPTCRQVWYETIKTGKANGNRN